jgi:hypothetical protein
MTVVTGNRCKHAAYDGWEDSDRCLLDDGHSEPHNYLNPGNDPEMKARFEDNQRD